MASTETDALRAQIDETLRSTDAYKSIRELISTHARELGAGDEESERAALERLLARALPVAAAPRPLAPPSVATAALGVGAAPGRTATTGLQLRGRSCVCCCRTMTT